MCVKAQTKTDMKIQSLLIVLSFLFTGITGSTSATNDTTNTNNNSTVQHTTAPDHKPFTKEFSYIADLCANMNGGLKTGTTFLGMANIMAGFNTEYAGLWKGGQFYINAAATHGKSLSGEFIGDYQVVSNIDAGNHIYLHELWYRHSISGFEITIGLQDMNVAFANSENGSHFINSSFGVPSVISCNIPAPIFPLTAPGVTSKLSISESVVLKAAIWDGCPTAFDRNTNNLNWHLKRDDGTLLNAEIEIASRLLKMPGIFKVGYYYHSGYIEKSADTGSKTEVFKNNYGFYLLADQTLWKQNAGEQKLGMFAQLAISPERINRHHLYIGGGINYSGFSHKQLSDVVGLAFACAMFNQNTISHETTIEIYYKKCFGQHLFIQPDLQYVISPAGTPGLLPNALVGVVRFGVFL